MEKTTQSRQEESMETLQNHHWVGSKHILSKLAMLDLAIINKTKTLKRKMVATSEERYNSIRGIYGMRGKTWKSKN
jgi:hypothetical protein